MFPLAVQEVPSYFSVAFVIAGVGFLPPKAAVAVCVPNTPGAYLPVPKPPLAVQLEPL